MAVSLGLYALQTSTTRGNDRNNIQVSRMSFPTRVGGARLLQEQRKVGITEGTNTFNPGDWSPAFHAAAQVRSQIRSCGIYDGRISSRRIISEYFVFLCQISFPQLLHIRES